MCAGPATSETCGRVVLLNNRARTGCIQGEGRDKQHVEYENSDGITHRQVRTIKLSKKAQSNHANTSQSDFQTSTRMVQQTTCIELESAIATGSGRHFETTLHWRCHATVLLLLCIALVLSGCFGVTRPSRWYVEERSDRPKRLLKLVIARACCYGTMEQPDPNRRSSAGHPSGLRIRVETLFGGHRSR